MIAALLDHLWQSTLFAVAVAALALPLRRYAARLRFALWLAASLKFLAPFSALVLLGRWLLPAAIIPGAESGAVLASLKPAMLPFSAGPILAPPTVITAQVLMLVWAAGTLVALGRALWHGWEMRLLLASAVELNIAAPVPVMSASSFLEPGLIGIWRPVILLPEGLARNLTREELDAVLSHELSHFARHDNLAAATHMLVEALFWFHPLVWWIGRRMVEERERACDENVLVWGSAPLVYAQSILKICRYYVQTPLACASGMSGPDLNVRLTAIMAGDPGKDLPQAANLLLAMAGAAALMMPIAAGMLGTSPLSPIAARMERALNTPLPGFSPVLPLAGAMPAAHHMLHRHRVVPKIKETQAPPVDTAAPPEAAAPVQASAVPVIVTYVSPAVPVITPVDDIKCRHPEALPGSRVLGPTICEPESVWTAFRAKGLDVAPDGSIYARSDYEKANSQFLCNTKFPSASGNVLRTPLGCL
ncbi:MAG TPA: M56 family metallopeptidase [Rhizomicrobium sp.]|nr:M56 family metallopeptidase [Rhizomicrobium sp.]